VVSGVATGTVAGFGFLSYQLALQAIAELVKQEPERQRAEQREPAP
jgi:3-dehydroquinate dehydratase-2